MKTTGTSNTAQQFVDRVQTGGTVGQLDVGEDQAGLLVLGKRHRVGMGARDADHVVAEIAHEALEIHRDEGLVLDDQDVGGDLGGHLAARGIGELAGFGNVDAEDVGHLLLRKAFQRQQEESLARQRGNIGETALRRHRQRRHLGIVVERNRIPDLREQPEQAGPGAMLAIQQRGVLKQGLQHGRDIGVARRLVSGQRAGIAPQQR